MTVILHRRQQLRMLLPVIETPVTNIDVGVDQRDLDLGDQQELFAGADQVIVVGREDKSSPHGHTKQERCESAHDWWRATASGARECRLARAGSGSRMVPESRQPGNTGSNRSQPQSLEPSDPAEELVGIHHSTPLGLQFEHPHRPTTASNQ